MAKKPAKAAKQSNKPTASAAPKRRARVVETREFRRGTDGPVFHLDVKTKPVGKIITASVGGKVSAIAITR